MSYANYKIIIDVEIPDDDETIETVVNNIDNILVMDSNIDGFSISYCKKIGEII